LEYPALAKPIDFGVSRFSGIKGPAKGGTLQIDLLF
jgi:hypothetical protein